MDKNPADSADYIRILKQTKNRRKLFFATVLIYIPALYIAYLISPTNRAMGGVFTVWVLMLIIATFMVALSRCPRCGNYFHLQGLTLLVLRRCLHCQLHIGKDTNI